MPNVTLSEYSITGEGYVANGNTLTFDPNPNNIKKSVEVKWRIRRPGLHKKVERGRFRANEKIEWSITGSCSGSKRDEIEFYSKRDSLFKLRDTGMRTPHAQHAEDEYPEGGGNAFETPPTFEDEVATDYGEGEGVGVPVFVIIEKVDFTRVEAKLDWFDYSMTLKRVHLTRH